MTTAAPTARRHPRAGRLVLVAGLALIGLAALWLLLTGNTGIRYSADHTDTVPMWHRWIPALVGIALIRLVPPATGPRWPDPVAPWREATPLLLAGVAFAAIMPLLGGEPAYTVVKLVLLLGVPVGVFLVARRWPPRWRPAPAPPDAAHRWGPALPVAVWLALSYATPLAVPASGWGRTVTPVELVVTVLVVFAVNALLEEVFYRRWLQTRWESLLGRWPAIVLASLVWAAWHVAIQGSGRPGTDLASVAVNQGVQGLFLGYLWSRYRRMWPPLVVHGAVNAMPGLLGM
ncbi:CPBP family intramembrane glutamic endopeptidase [Micromonospora humi]|uniref:Membrane protease YdiL, CAAX protease family n=1 Tax=Micromonospora humi TaxID=745366 RepID=A0A1C5HQY4_9ACTN|nr:CPBP family intramembrane glutamic endopeptidase [Micromonospora humi]SCG48392.1 Membrane protease YdiL, CAAX protease family [Micromonospora humi]